ncbi:MAG: sodium:solute symporter family protein [Bdellovibrionaceae bacterium]|nr:sodium:solute symporter family protein [Bdellovibrionales bacterium]MCB9085559.1 sodium:solute symporter family protein [Pseudobdellovibrionaceae bacterium]
MNLTILLLYLLGQFAICYYISKRIESEDDYLVAGRKLPLYMISISLFATWFGAETCIGSSAAVYESGISGSRADPFGYSLCLILSGLLIAPRLWSKKYFTLADLYRDRFGDSTQSLATWILSLSSLIWAAAQLRAFGHVVSATTDLPVNLTLFLSFCFVLAYTTLAGLMGDVITDVIQGAIITIGLFVLLYLVLSQSGPIGDLLIAQQTGDRLSLIAPNETWWERADRWAIPILGSLVAQEIVARIFAAKSRSVAVIGCYSSAAIYLVVGSIPVALGLMGPHLIQVEGDSEQFLILLAQKYMPWFLVPVFAGALISALLATIDSILLSVGALVAHNVLIPALKVTEENKKLRLNRTVVVVAGVVAYVMAIYSEGIYELLETASSFGTSGILIITILGLWSKWGCNRTATVTLITGLVATPVGEYIFKVPSPFLVSIAVSLMVFFAMSLVKPKAASSPS